MLPRLGGNFLRLTEHCHLKQLTKTMAAVVKTGGSSGGGGAGGEGNSGASGPEGSKGSGAVGSGGSARGGNGGGIKGGTEEIFVLDTQPYTPVTEGKAEVLFPASLDVFYNPVQEFNRDLSIAVLRVFALEHKRTERDKRRKAEAKEKRKQQALVEKATSSDQKEAKEGTGRESNIVFTGSNGEENGDFGSDRTIGKDNRVDRETDISTGVSRNGDVGNDEATSWKSNSNEDSEKKTTETEASSGGSENEEATEEEVTVSPPGTRDEGGIRILEGLAASGLRSIRYAREVGGIREVVANDISERALECMRRNIEHNNVSHLVLPSHNDASMVMYQNREPEKRFHAIDLDPYGSPHLFLDGAVQSVAEGGILLVTCTDMAVLCGNSPESCYAKYGALSLKSKACHEMALRIVLQCLESHANRYSRYIVPLLSLTADFYVRVVVKVFSSKVKVKESFSKVSWVYQCVGCETTTLQPLGQVIVNNRSVKHKVTQGPPVTQSCTHCGHRHVVGGPIWSAPIHDREFLATLKNSLVEEDFGTYSRMFGVLSMMEEELPDVPLYYVNDRLSHVARTNLCKMKMFRSALLNAGYRVSLSHATPSSIKTNAPARVVWDVVRAWVKQQPMNKSTVPADHPSRVILQQEIQTDISFELHPDADPESRKKELLRFQVNPEKFWGPRSRAKTSLLQGTLEEKRARKQGKKRKPPPTQSPPSTKHCKEDSTSTTATTASVTPGRPQQDQEVA